MDEINLIEQLVAMRQALQRIAEWDEHPVEMAVDYGSNGVRDYYRRIALDAIEQAETEIEK